MVQDSALPFQGAQVRFLVRELKSRKMYSTAKKKKKYLFIKVFKYTYVCVCVCVCVYKTTLKVHSNYLICRKTQDWGDRVASKSLDLEMESSKKQMSRHGSKGEETW